jgi:tetratricopeptide (TPR) repeat protein
LTARKIFIPVFSFLLLAASFAQSGDCNSLTSRFNRGLNLYGDGYWGDAIIEFRNYQREAPNAKDRAEAQFWIAMSEMAAGEYFDAIHDFDDITRTDPLSVRRYEVPYQKARAYFYLGRYNDAIVLFTQYADSIRIDGRYINGVRAENWNVQTGGIEEDYQKKASAIFWIGECLYNLDHFDKAAEMYNTIITQYTRSHKYESSTNRIALIKQKKIEEELLQIVKNSTQKQDGGGYGATGAKNNPSSAAFGSEYNEAMLAYKNSIAPYLLRDASKDSYTPSGQAAMQPTKNAYPEAELPRPARTPANVDTTMRLLTIKTQALEMMERLTTTLSAFETISQESW